MEIESGRALVDSHQVSAYANSELVLVPLVH